MVFLWRLVGRLSARTSGVAVVTPTDRPKLVRNRCVIEVFVACCVVMLFFFFGRRCFGHRTASDLFLFLYMYICY